MGDSLAAGMLFDRSDSAGYAGYIKSDLELEPKGYQVKLDNQGVSGATSKGVLDTLLINLTEPKNLEKLAMADIITISAGANDVLAGLDTSVLEGVDPRYLDPDYPALLKAEAQNAGEIVKKAAEEVTSAMIIAEEPVNEAQNMVRDTKVVIDATVNEFELYRPVVPILGEILDAMLLDIQTAAVSLEGANEKLYAGKTAYKSGKSEEISTTLATSGSNIGTAVKELNSVMANIEELELYIKSVPSIPDNVKTAIQNVENAVSAATIKANTAKSAVEDGEEAVTKFITASATAKEAQIIADTAAQIEASLTAKLAEIKDDAESAIASVGINLVRVIGTIKEVNPTAKIYVMGYYNALPYLPIEVQQKVTIPLLDGLNEVIEGAAEHTKANFIPTFKLFEGNYRTYLPNPKDIHPSKEGYRALANAFKDPISSAFPGYSEPEPPSELTVDLKEKVNVFAGQQLLINDTEVSLLLPIDLPEGTTLTVTETTKDTLAKAEDLTSYGAALNFKFEYPEGREDYEGKYELVMGYVKGSPDDVNIYYYNEKTGKWEGQKAKVDAASQKISLEVSHFSNYGVFAKAEIKKDPPKTKDPIIDKTPVVPKPPTKGSDKNDGSTVKVKTAIGGKKLPTTATNTYNLLLIGTLILVSGIAGLAIRPKKHLIKNEA